MKKTDLKNLSVRQLKEFLASIGGESYNAKQIIQWLYQKRTESFEDMTNLSKDIRDRLQKESIVSRLQTSNIFREKGGTTKFLFRLSDDNQIEAVLIPDRKRLTLCVSSQVGCAMGCKFCLTGKMGWKRNLSIAEILNQVLMVQETLEEGESITNVVFMGMGEPFANYDNVLSAVELLLNKDGFAFHSKRITVSTSGLIPQIERFSKGERPCRLAISLNAADDNTRSQLMPVNKKYSLQKLIEACRRISLANKEQITFEYVMIEGVNDRPGDAKRLINLLKGIPAKVNLIPLNESEEIPFKRPSGEITLAFQKILKAAGIITIIRTSKGKGVSGACGQLSTNNSIKK